MAMFYGQYAHPSYRTREFSDGWLKGAMREAEAYETKKLVVKVNPPIAMRRFEKDGVKTPHWTARKRDIMVVNPYSVDSEVIRIREATVNTTVQKFFVTGTVAGPDHWGRAVMAQRTIPSVCRSFHTVESMRARHTEVEIPFDESPGHYWNKALAASTSALFDLASNLAESRETVSTLKTLVPNLLRDLRKMRNDWLRLLWMGVNPRQTWNRIKKRKRYRDALRRKVNPFRKGTPQHHAASYYLLYRFGYVPTASAINDLLLAVETTFRWYYDTKRAGVRTPRMDKVLNETPIPGVGTLVERLETFGLISAGVKSRYTETDLARSDRASLYLPTAAWEITPWSWLVDRFSHVGNWLQGWRDTPAAERVGWLTVKTVSTLKYELRLDTDFREPPPFRAINGYANIDDQQTFIIGVDVDDPLLAVSERQTVRRTCPPLTPVMALNTQEMNFLQRLDVLAATFIAATGSLKPKRS